MNAHLNQHLNEEQFDSLISGESAPDSHAGQHLLACSDCREEFEGLRSALTGFRVAGQNFSAAFAPTQAPAAQPARRALRFFPMPQTAWAAGLAAAMALCVATLPYTHKVAVAPAPAIQTASVEAGAAGPSDDALLESIDSDLSTSVPTSLQPLDTNAATESSPVSNRN